MSTASMMSGLLNASGLKERLQELSSKSGSLPSGFQQAEAHRTRDGFGDDGFTSQLDRLSREVSHGELSSPAREDGENDTAEVAMTAFADEALDGPQEASVDADVEALIRLEGADSARIADREGPASPQSNREADAAIDTDDGSLSQTLMDDSSNSAYPATAGAERVAGLSAQQMPVQAAIAGDGYPAPSEDARKIDIAENSKVFRDDLLARREGASVVRVDGRSADWPGQGGNRTVANELFQKPVTANDTRTRQHSAEFMMRSGRAGPMPGDAPLVTVGGFKMSSEHPIQPGNFSERFSRQLDMMRPVFRSLPGSDGLGKAVEAGGQVMSLQTGNVTVGTITQVQQTIQSSLVNLARESTANGPVTKTMELSLLPRSLGEIRVHMVHSGSGISVEIVTNSAAATRAMESAKNDIVRAYLQYGIQPDEVNIRVTETRDAAQQSLSTGSDQDRGSQASGQGLARNGTGTSMAERQDNTGHLQEEDAVYPEREDGLKQADPGKPTRAGVVGKVQYF